MTQQQIHTKALEVAGRYQRSVSELLEILQTLDARKTFREYECTSLFQYAVKHLKLSEDVAFNFITVARKAIEVPALKQEIQAGTITVAKARKICSVLTAGNQSHWLAKATEVSTRELEREVARVNPKAAVAETSTYVAEDRIRLVLGVSEEFMKMLKRVQDLEARSTQKSGNHEAALQASLESYLEKHDPIRRAKRVVAAKNAKSATACPVTRRVYRSESIQAQDAGSEYLEPKIKSTSLRKPLASALRHQLRLRDQDRCAMVDSSGKRCAGTRWLDFHHVIPLSKGGEDTLGNLVTLCHTHHQRQHLRT